MIRHLVLAALLFVPLAAHGQVDAVDLTAVFVDGGVKIDRLLVYEIGGVVLLRGRTGNPLMAAQAGARAACGGVRYSENAGGVRPDKALVKSARHELDMARELDGCRFQIDSAGGIVRLRGHVVREAQGDYAVYLIAKIDGVKQVHSELTLSAPVSGGSQ